MSATINVNRLARDFMSEVAKRLTAAELREVRALNATPEYQGACATHNFADTNLLMATALERQGIELDCGDEAQLAAWNQAWSMAKAAEFSPSKLRRSAQDRSGTNAPVR